MSASPASPFTLDEAFAFLQDGGSAPIVVKDAGFWSELMSGKPTSPGPALVANGSGWLVGIYAISQDAQAWERHPAGDELLTMLRGEMDVVLEQPGGDATLTLREGQSCLVPRGTWHRQVVRRPGEYLGATYGRGTEHRPR